MDVPCRPRSRILTVRNRLRSCDCRLIAENAALSYPSEAEALMGIGGARSGVERFRQSLALSYPSEAEALMGIGGARSGVERFRQSLDIIPETEECHSGSHGRDHRVGTVVTEMNNAGSVLSNAHARDIPDDDVPTSGSGAGMDASSEQARGISESGECIVNMSNGSIHEPDLSSLPFHEKSLDLAIPHMHVKVDESSVQQLVSSANRIDNPTEWFAEASIKVFPGGEEELKKEHVAVHLLELMSKKELRSSGMSLLYEILSPEKPYNHLARYTLFVAAVRKMKLKNVLAAVQSGCALLHYVAQLGYIPIIQLLCKWGVDINMKTRITNATPLLTVVSHIHLDADLTAKTVEVLFQCGAEESVNDENSAGDSPLFMAIVRRQAKVFDQLLRKGADPTKLDKAGNTILHAAAQVNAVKVCRKIMATKNIDKELMVGAKNDDGQTPIHLAAMHGPKFLETVVEALGKNYSDCVEWFSALDNNNCTALDIAAQSGQQDTFAFMWEEMEKYSPAHIDVERRKLRILIEEAEKDSSQWQKVNDALSIFPKRMLHKLFVGNGADDMKPSFQRLITASGSGTPVNMEHEHQESVRTVLDKSLFGDRVIVTETLDGSKHTAQFKLGGLCESRAINRPKGSNLAALCTSDFQVWDHQAVTLWLNQKLKTCRGIGLLLYFFLYWAFLGVSGFALEAAVNVDATSKQLLDYSNENNKQRQTLEIIAATLWLMLLIPDLFDVFRFRLYYLKWFGVYPRIAVHLLFFVLLVTRFCGHNSQWVLASLFVICAAARAMEVFTVWNWSSVYLITLWIILRRELLKFLVIALLLVLSFSVAMRFAMQAERVEAKVEGTLKNRSNLLSIFSDNFDALVRGPPRVQSNGGGLESYSLFTAIIYLAFLGLVVLLLVSVFIAQANGCYNDVKDIADQMANYSCARLLTQTSTMLPVWLFNAIAKKCKCIKVPPYVWSDWPCHSTGCTKAHFLRSIWQIIPSVLVTDSSSLVKSKGNQRGIDELKSDFDDVVKVVQEENMSNFNALKSEMDELKFALRMIQRQLAGQHANQQTEGYLHRSSVC